MVNVGALIYVYTWDQKLIMGIGDVITVFESSMVQVFIDLWSPMNKNLFVSPSIFRKNIAMPFIIFTLRFSQKIGSVSKPCTPVVHIKVAGKWMFIPLKMVSIGIDPYPILHGAMP